MAFSIEGKAQVLDTHNLTPNTNYKDQIPKSKGLKFRDSFKNTLKEDPSEENYKHQQVKKNRHKKSPAPQNFEQTILENDLNSKHPYGL
ncbi:MAG TPA: hypothetical protein VK766_01000 [Cytophagaceae bacterium]|nr:hypothetical protein [Cytophagaceae bacterium]